MSRADQPSYPTNRLLTKRNPGREGTASAGWCGGSYRVLGLLGMFVLTAAATAQQGTKDLTEASLEELSNIQVYSASKHMQSVSDAPSSVTVITADEIQKYGYRSLAEIRGQPVGCLLYRRIRS